ncbi:MAG: type II/IV secretion system protein, partial [Dehalococcoidia bacterium]
MSETKKVEYGEKTKNRIIKYLEAQGYEVTVDAKREGKSGITHTFDMLAANSDELSPDIVAVSIIVGGDKQHEATAIFNFANKAFDANIKNRVLVAVP